MATTIDSAKIEDQLQQKLNSRMDSVRGLVRSRQAVLDARDALSTAEDEDVRQYQVALRAGWTVDELKQSGLPEPEKKARVRKRSVSRSASNSTNEKPAPQRTDSDATALNTDGERSHETQHAS